MRLEMRSPNGSKSFIDVEPTAKGVDLVFSRSSDGEMLVHLPAWGARRVADAILAALEPHKETTS